MKSIGAELSKSIKEQCWVYLEYHNQQGGTTYFWAAVKAIKPKSKKIVVDMFNPKKYEEGSKDIIEATIFFDGIKDYKVLRM